MICSFSSACRLLLNSSGAQLFTALNLEVWRGEREEGRRSIVLDLGFGFGFGGSFLDFVNLS